MFNLTFALFSSPKGCHWADQWIFLITFKYDKSMLGVNMKHDFWTRISYLETLVKMIVLAHKNFIFNPNLLGSVLRRNKMVQKWGQLLEKVAFCPVLILIQYFTEKVCVQNSIFKTEDVYFQPMTFSPWEYKFYRAKIMSYLITKNISLNLDDWGDF